MVVAALANRAWRALGQIYAIRGARKLVDAVAVNSFTQTPDGVITILQLVRQAMNRLGASQKPLYATELSWPSAIGQPVIHHDWDTTERGQRRKIAALLPMLAAKHKSLGLASFFTTPG